MAGCGAGGGAPGPSTPAVEQEATGPELLPQGKVPRFRFRSLDGREVSSDVALGRNTVLAFLSTFDWASQAQARFLSGLEHNHRPRTNFYAIVLEQSDHGPLVEAFVSTLSLRYPVVHITSEKLLQTELRAIRTVPTVLVLDAGGNLVWKSQGLVAEEALAKVLRAVEGRGSSTEL